MCEKYYFNKNQILLWLIKNTTLASFATWKHNDNFLCCESTTTVLLVLLLFWILHKGVSF